MGKRKKYALFFIFILGWAVVSPWFAPPSSHVVSSYTSLSPFSILFLTLSFWFTPSLPQTHLHPRGHANIQTEKVLINWKHHPQPLVHLLLRSLASLPLASRMISPFSLQGVGTASYSHNHTKSSPGELPSNNHLPCCWLKEAVEGVKCLAQGHVRREWRMSLTCFSPPSAIHHPHSPLPSLYL